MTKQATPAYPGKPGPAPTGLRRGILFPLQLDDEEFEYLNRKAYQVFKTKRRAAPFARQCIFTSGWQKELVALRDEQGANVP